MRIPAEITAYVMALPVEDVRRLTATEIMGWKIYRAMFPNADGIPEYQEECLVESDRGLEHIIFDDYDIGPWRPDIDRNQSRVVTDKIKDTIGWDALSDGALLLGFGTWSYDMTPDQESRAALIAHMIHAEERLWRYRLIHKEKSYGDTA